MVIKVNLVVIKVKYIVIHVNFLQNFEKNELFSENMNFLTKFCEQLVQPIVMLSRKKRRKQERQEKKARKYDRYKKLKGLSATEHSRVGTEERKRPEIPPAKKKRRLASKKQTQIEQGLVEDRGIEKEKKELKRLEKLLSIKERKEEKQKKLPNAFIRDGLDCIL